MRPSTIMITIWVSFVLNMAFSICINGSGSGFTADLMYKIEYSLRDDQR